MSIITKNWHLIQHKPNSRDRAVLNLRKQGITVFLPQIENTDRKGNKFFKKTVSLFPGYFFIKFDYNFTHWHTINSTYGVLKIIMFGGKPSIVPNKIIYDLKEIVLKTIFFLKSKQ